MHEIFSCKKHINVLFSEVKKKLTIINQQFSELSATRKKLEDDQSVLVEEKQRLDTQVDKHCLDLKTSERDYQNKAKDLNHAKAREAVLKGDR